MNPNLGRLLAAADPEDRQWLEQALARWRDGEPLEHALGLSGPRAVKQRNAALRRAADLLDLAGELSPWARAGRLEKAIRYFGGRNNDSLLAKTIAEIIELESSNGVRPVRCQRAIYEIIR